MQRIVLDPNIRNWVLLPLLLVLFMVGLLRHYVTLLLKSNPKSTLDAIKDAQTFQRSRMIRSNSGYIPFKSFQMRKDYFTNKENGLFKKVENAEPPNPMAGLQQMQDPSMMMDMMKKNMAMVVPNIVMMNWIGSMFSGFVTVKLPFPLTLKFKTMLQRGIDLTTLEPGYVSAISLYFLTLSGYRGLFSLVLGENNETDESKMMQQQMNPAAGGPGAADPQKLKDKERENIELVTHKFKIGEAESRIVNKYRI